MSHNDTELNFELELTEQRVREILSQIEQAKRIAMQGQVLRIKLNANTVLVFRNLNVKTVEEQPKHFVVDRLKGVEQRVQ